MDNQELEQLYQKALDLAARQLSYRALSTGALRDKLLAAGIPEDAADWAVAWMQERGLLDDAAYAAGVRRSYERRGYGELRIRQELRRRGVGTETAESALDEYEADLGRMSALLDKRLHGDLSDRKEVQKAVAALQRRGYRWDDIRAALKAYGAQIDDDFS